VLCDQLTVTLVEDAVADGWLPAGIVATTPEPDPEPLACQYACADTGTVTRAVAHSPITRRMV
jgi:hypothetical protein